MSNPETTLEALKKSIRQALPDLELVLGWEQGYDALHATPLFIKKPEDVDRLIIGPTCVQTLAGYLPSFKGKKVGIVVKGCDSRAVAELLSEGLISRDDVTIFGFGCNGIVGLRRLSTSAGDVSKVESVTQDGESLRLVIDGKDKEYDYSDVCAPKCLTCKYPNAVVSDHFAGPEATSRVREDVKTQLDEFEEMTLQERFDFWKEQMKRCVRCYACRNACPMCVCKDHCLATTRTPRFLSQEASVSENLMFQLIHVSHLAGRCVSCGECERVCPMGIPLGLLRAKSNRIMSELFNHEAGLDPECTPPLLTFKADEETIKEHNS